MPQRLRFNAVAVLLLPVAVLTAGCGPSPTVGRTTAADHMTALDSIFSAYDRPDVPGAGVLVIRNGQVVASRSYGLADLERRTPAGDRTSYRLASLSKQFTATAIMLLARDGRVRYDDRVTDHLPGLPAHARDVRVRHLLTHTSGLQAYEDFVPDSQTTQVKDRDVLALLQQADSLYFAPGTA